MAKKTGASGRRIRRMLVKLSGESLAGERKLGLDPETVKYVARELAAVHAAGVEMAVVIGGGNIFRGSLGESIGIERTTGDYMGMLATVINSLAMREALEAQGVPARVMTSFAMEPAAEPFVRARAVRHLEKKRVVIVAGGTGNPYFTTDTAAGLRAIELGADLLLKATRVDGVYDSDPEKNKNAARIDTIGYLEVIGRKLRVMDLTAISLCMDNSLPIVVFDLMDRGAMRRIARGERVGTLIS